MKAGIVGVSLEEFLAAARSVKGISILPQKGFVKITGNKPGLAVYPQNNKTVGEVHFSGFALEPKVKIAGLMPNPKYPKPTRRVTHFLDQREGLTKEQIISNFKEAISMMVAAEELAPVELVIPMDAAQAEPMAIAAEESDE